MNEQENPTQEDRSLCTMPTPEECNEIKLKSQALELRLNAISERLDELIDEFHRFNDLAVKVVMSATNFIGGALKWGGRVFVGAILIAIFGERFLPILSKFFGAG